MTFSSLDQIKNVMTQEQFWKIINISNKGKRLKTALKDKSYDELLAFMCWYAYFQQKAVCKETSVAGNILANAGADDGYLDFLEWLILQGKEVYAKSLKHPDNLVEFCNPRTRMTSYQKEGMSFYAVEIAERKFLDKDLEEDYWDTMDELEMPDCIGVDDLEYDWIEDEEKLEKIAPKLFKKFYWDRNAKKEPTVTRNTTRKTALKGLVKSFNIDQESFLDMYTNIMKENSEATNIIDYWYNKDEDAHQKFNNLLDKEKAIWRELYGEWEPYMSYSITQIDIASLGVLFRTDTKNDYKAYITKYTHMYEAIKIYTTLKAIFPYKSEIEQILPNKDWISITHIFMKYHWAKPNKK